MEVERLLTLQVEGVPDALGFAADIEAHALELVRQEYEGICYGGAFVAAILGIERAPLAPLLDLDGRARAWVVVRARVIALAPGDALPGLVQITRTAPMIEGRLVPGGAQTGGGEGPATQEGGARASRREASSEAAPVETGTARGGQPDYNVTFAVNPRSRAVRAGQVVPARVVHKYFTPFQTSAQVHADVFACPPAAPVFEARPGLRPDGGTARTLVAALAARLRAAYAERAAILADPVGAERAAFFERLFARADPPAALGPDASGYIHAPGAGDRPPSPRPGGARVADLLTLAASPAGLPAGYWTRPAESPGSAPYAVRRDGPPAGQADGVPALGAEEVLAFLLQDATAWATAVNQLARHFRDPALLASHENVWGAIRLARAAPAA
jgi:hypothetical protein